MKKKVTCLLCILLTAGMLFGCAKEGEVLSELKTERYVTLGEYKGIEAKMPARETVVEEYKQNYINYELSTHTQWIPIEQERPAQMGDTVNIDYEGKKDGVAFEGGTDTGFDLQLGSGTFIPGFEEGLVGVKAGETKDLELTFPEQYTPELAGEDVVFTVTVNEIKEAKLPELTDEFVQGLDNDCTTVEEYEAFVQKTAESVYEEDLETQLLNALMDSSTFEEPPQAMVDQYYDKAVGKMSRLAAANGMSLETLVTTYYGSTMEEFKTQARAGAVQSCKEAIMLQAVANAENIEVTSAEIEEALKTAAAESGYGSVDALKADMGDDNYEDYVMCDKVLELLKANAVITEETMEQ